ncbi:MAG: family 20 glycosylhydrolase [Clostridia bacterium]|nr:family 20 glycosylhydrolase [Clostridia bacterium]
MKLMPSPRKIEYGANYISLSKSYSVKCPFDYPRALKYLNTFIVSDTKAENAVIFARDGKMEDEEYSLKFDGDITVTSNGERGAHLALTTLKQIVAEGETNVSFISDKPKVKLRGYMLDVSRGRLPKVERLHEIVDIIADMKYNHFELYIDTRVFEYAHFKKYCENCLTPADIISLREHCKDRFVDLCPNQNGFGHMAGWLGLDEFRHLGISREDGKPKDTLNPLLPEAVEHAKALYADTLPLFESEYANVGMDEPFSLGKGETKEECDRRGKGEVYVEYLNKILSFVKEEYGKTPMFWDDHVMAHPDSIPKIYKDSIALVWGYEQEWPQMERCRLLAEQGRRFIVCPSTANFNSITGRFNNAQYNIDGAVRSCLCFGGEGVIVTDWGDGGHPQCFAMSLMPLAFAASCMWNYCDDREITPIKHLVHEKMTGASIACEEYLDRAVFGVKGLARLTHLMQNYYLLESRLSWAGPHYECEANQAMNNVPSRLDPLTMRLIEGYMREIKAELLKYPKDTPHIDDIILNCDMVIAIHQFSQARRANDTEALAKIREFMRDIEARFLILWRKNSFDRGFEIFLEKENGIWKRIKNNIDG